jgi:hypothetical protein
LTLSKDGRLHRQIVNLLNGSVSMIRYIIKKSQSEVTVTRKHRTGRSMTLTNRKEKTIIREIKKIQVYWLRSSLKWLPTTSARIFTRKLCRRILRDNDFHGGIPRKHSLTGRIKPGV